ncbi:MAG: VWA domain-containing protein [Polyangiaceae bacterium]|nr:VWA domain-containing protein [Polyangiaceae bacterium]
MPLSLRFPWGLALLGLLLPLVVLYILKVRRERRLVASTWLWAQARRDLMAKSPFRRLVPQVPLFLQALALILLALALASPATRGGAIIGDHVAVVVDTSASMSAAAPEGGRRIDLAKRAAKDVLASLGPGSDAMVVEAGADARIASPLDRDRKRLEAAVDQLDARDVEGNLGRALAIAADRLRQLPGSKRVVIVTDGALTDPQSLETLSLPFDVIRVGQTQPNTAIVRLDVRDGISPATKRPEVQAFALVAHHGAQPREVFVTLRLRNVAEPLASRKLVLKPGERAPVVLAFEPTAGDRDAGLLVELSPSDAMPRDDVAFGRVPAGRTFPVVLAPAGGNPWVQRALLADPDVQLSGVALDQLATAGVPPEALVVIDGACPASVPGGDLLILNPPPGRCRTAVVGEPIKLPTVTSWAEADPRLRFLTLDGIVISSARRIETEGPSDPLVRAREGTLISDISVPGRSGTLVGFEVGESNWPLKVSFVLFLRNVVELARTHRARGITGPAKTGQPLSVRVPPDVDSVMVVGPDERELRVPARSGLAVVPDVTRAGFYFVSWEGPRAGSVLIPANLTSELESDLTVRELSRAGSPVAVTAAEDVQDAFTEWAWLIALLALGFVVLDAVWLTRRPSRGKGTLEQAPLRPERRASGDAA